MEPSIVGVREDSAGWSTDAGADVVLKSPYTHSVPRGGADAGGVAQGGAGWGRGYVYGMGAPLMTSISAGDCDEGEKGCEDISHGTVTTIPHFSRLTVPEAGLPTTSNISAALKVVELAELVTVTEQEQRVGVPEPVPPLVVVMFCFRLDEPDEEV